MPDATKALGRGLKTWAGMVLLATAAAVAMTPAARADEASAKTLFKAMSDYLAGQNAIAFDFDSNLEVVTTDQQKIGLASSGTVTLNRPDKIRMTRTGGFADVEFVFDGKTVTLLGKNDKVYVQEQVPGSIDNLVDELRNKFNRPVPAADLLLSDVYKQITSLATDMKDLGSGVIRGVECDHVAIRTAEVDLQIWIAQGNRPYPCRYVITSQKVTGSPQYTIDVRTWKTGAEVAADNFTVQVPDGAKKMTANDLPDIDELPAIFAAKK